MEMKSGMKVVAHAGFYSTSILHTGSPIC